MAQATRMQALEAAMNGAAYQSVILVQVAQRIEREQTTREAVRAWVAQGIAGAPVNETARGIGFGL